MANDLNQCNFTGRLGKDVEVKYSVSGTAIANISIAVGGSRKNGDNWEDTVVWVPIILFAKKAELAAQYLSKGSQIRITGKFQVRKWQDQSGNDQYRTDIIADEMQFLGGSKQQGAPAQNSHAPQGSPAQQQQAPQQQGGAPANNFDDFDQDIPF